VLNLVAEQPSVLGYCNLEKANTAGQVKFQVNSQRFLSNLKNTFFPLTGFTATRFDFGTVRVFDFSCCSVYLVRFSQIICKLAT
jgi:hypothetical protein